MIIQCGLEAQKVVLVSPNEENMTCTTLYFSGSYIYVENKALPQAI